MYLTNNFFNLISLTNLTIFVTRLIRDGQYQSAVLLYDYASIGDTNFIQELTDSPNRNFTLVTLRVTRFGNSDWILEMCP